MNEPKATRYQRLRRRAQALGRLSAGGALGVLAFTPAGPLVWRTSSDLTRGMPFHVAQPIALLLLVAIVCAICGAAALPALRYRLREVDATYGRPSEAGRSKLSSLLIVVAAAAACAAVVIVSATLTGSFWWLVTAGVLGMGLLAAGRLAPHLVGREAVGPLGRPTLERRIAALADRASVPVSAVQRWITDDASTAVATVTGVGSARRVLVAGEVARDWSDDEVVVIVAHELAHHVHGDLERTMALDAAVIALALLASDAVLRLVGGALGLAGPADPAALPLVAFVALTIWFAATPVRHAQSRRQERRADRWALAWTRQSGAFQSAIRRASARRLADENPGAVTRWLYHRHPPVTERLDLAARYAERD